MNPPQVKARMAQNELCHGLPRFSRNGCEGSIPEWIMIVPTDFANGGRQTD